MAGSWFASASAVLAVFAGLAFGQRVSPEGGFELLEAVPAEVVAARANVRPEKFQAVGVRWEQLKRVLADAPLEDTPGAAHPVVLSLPRPDGTWEAFAVVESPVMEAGLAAAFPEIRTYAGQGLDDPAATVRLDYTPHGFHAQVFTEDGSYYVDPYSFAETGVVTSYWKRDLRAPMAWRCMTDEGTPVAEEEEGGGGYTDRAIVTRRQFRLAVATTVEYTAFHGNTAALGQAAVVTAVNRVNQIYERDLATRFVLVANNQSVIYVGTDNYANNGSTADLTTNQNNLNTVIGSANYDVGHVFQTGNGGVVGQIGALCSSTQKGRGLSGLPNPVNDPFVIDYVAHELGHQCGGRHCFNNCGGGAGDAQTYAFEPGSGATIMAYAGICGSTNLQSNSDAMFHSGSLDLMAAHINGRTCDTETVTTNNTPTVNAGPDYTIPKQTPFVLTATGSDSDGNAITYSWEQRNTGTASVAVGTDNGTNPIQRTWLPTSSPSRTLPRLSNLLANTTAFGEILPQVARTMQYRVVARDNASGNGGTAVDNVVITVNGTAGPFTVTAPNAAGSFSGTTTVTWNVASTNLTPVSCANVRILLSTNGGNSFSTVLVESTPNDGSEVVTLPSVSTTQARIKVEAVGNIFFDISNANFTITPGVNVNFAGTGTNTTSDTALNGNANGVIDPGEEAISLTVRMVNSGTTTATGVSGTLTSLTPTVTVVSGASAYPSMPTGTQVNNLFPFVLSVSPSHVCGAPISLRLNLASTQGSGVYNFSLPTGLPGPVCQPPVGECPSDFNGDGVVDGDDVIGFFGAWDAGGLAADFTGDGSVDGDDVIGFFGAWDAGC
jgi:hypothetical protein